MQVVKEQSPVADNRPFLKNWDEAVRSRYSVYESIKVAASENIKVLQSNPLTKWRTVPQLRDRFTAIDTLQSQQMLGHIHDSEVAELNKVMGGQLMFYRSKKSSAELYTFDKFTFLALFAGGMSFAAIGLLTMRTNFLWLGAGVMPCLLHSQMAGRRQDQDVLQNAYRYLITKRAAVSDFEANKGKIEPAFNVKNYLTETHQTLYAVEQRLVNKIADEQFWAIHQIEL